MDITLGSFKPAKKRDLVLEFGRRLKGYKMLYDAKCRYDMLQHDKICGIKITVTVPMTGKTLKQEKYTTTESQEGTFGKPYKKLVRDMSDCQLRDSSRVTRRVTRQLGENLLNICELVYVIVGERW